MKYFYAERSREENLRVIGDMRTAIDRMMEDGTGYYNADYLDFAQDALGGYCQYGFWDGQPISLWFGMFAKTRFGLEFGKGEIAIITTMSATQLANYVKSYYYGIAPEAVSPGRILHLSKEEIKDMRHYHYGRSMALLSWYMSKEFTSFMGVSPIYESFRIFSEIMEDYPEDGQYLFIDEQKRLYDDRFENGVPAYELIRIFE